MQYDNNIICYNKAILAVQESSDIICVARRSLPSSAVCQVSASGLLEQKITQRSPGQVSESLA